MHRRQGAHADWRRCDAADPAYTDGVKSPPTVGCTLSERKDDRLPSVGVRGAAAAFWALCPQPTYISRLSTGNGACFITTDSGAQGSAGTHASATSFSMAFTIDFTPFSVETIIGADWATFSFISEAM